MEFDKEEQDIAEWSKAVRDADDVSRDNAVGRDNAIRKAAANGKNPTQLSRASGLARARIYQILAQSPN